MSKSNWMSKCVTCIKPFHAFRWKYHCHGCGSSICRSCSRLNTKRATVCRNCLSFVTEPTRVPVDCSVKEPSNESVRGARTPSKSLDIPEEPRTFATVKRHTSASALLSKRRYPKVPFPKNEEQRLRCLQELRMEFQLPHLQSCERLAQLLQQALTVASGEIGAIQLLGANRVATITTVGCPMLRMPREESLSSYVLLENAPVLVFDTKADVRCRNHPFVLAYDVQAFWSFPLYIRREIVGTLDIAFSTTTPTMSAALTSILQKFANVVATSIETSLQNAPMARAPMPPVHEDLTSREEVMEKLLGMANTTANFLDGTQSNRSTKFY
ncbi:hypothetical protein THRCLA_20696 [Thraustotheca clavata]|uniref:FYVE-type domain-containing protein n=1 Tax=Thraustotheca clavata TaxID=74557 RepID=A0A1W0A581_9STRA|nr:hypothetical protein THRCLA_20696 [Thraustotheca clavata]